MSENENKIELALNTKCKVEFDIDGNLKIGKNCEGAVINPAEIQILDRVNADIEKER